MTDAPHDPTPPAEAEAAALREKLAECERELEAIRHAAHMPADYEFGLPTYINMELYGKLILLLDRDGRVIRRSEDIEEMHRLRTAHAQTAAALAALQKRTRGLHEISHYPESMWLPEKEWGEDVWAAAVGLRAAALSTAPDHDAQRMLAALSANSGAETQRAARLHAALEAARDMLECYVEDGIVMAIDDENGISTAVDVLARAERALAARPPGLDAGGTGAGS
jgi:hypothetical protein